MNAQPAFDWADSGLMSLTGPAAGAPAVPAVDAIGALRGLLAEFARAAGRDAADLGVDLRLLTERAHLMRLRRGGQRSCNRSCRLVEARDGWLAVNLPRAEDFAMLLPWLGVEARAADAWPRLERAVAARDLADLLAAAAGLPIAVAALPEQSAAQSTDVANPDIVQPAASPVDVRGGAPLVVDLSSLWAGPLCAQLLARAGARVIKVESRARPEPMRDTWPAMFDRLHAGKQSVVLDFARDADLVALRALLARADIVIGSARPRAFAQLGLEPRAFLAANPRLAWIAITAHGWHGEDGHRVGFGDDAAAAAGLVVRDASGRPSFLGDAIADPLTGIAAATVALDAWRARRGGLYDLSLRASAARIAASPPLDAAERGTPRRHDGAWWLHLGAQRCRVAPPAAAAATGRATAFGADTRRILQEFN